MNDMNFFFPDSITISGHEYDCQRSKNQILVPYTEEPNVVFKKIERWEHEAVIERHRDRMQAAKGMMRKRSGLVEHPFGTIKHRSGMHHFLMRGLEKCQGEFGLMVLSYNFTRVLNILGIEKFRDHCAQRFENGQENWKYA